MEGPLHSFDEVALPHLDAAYNLARCPVTTKVKDVAQVAFLRAFRHSAVFKGGDVQGVISGIISLTPGRHTE
jgi:RNA polymerase sigma-70 factor (ECF subfamily)